MQQEMKLAQFYLSDPAQQTAWETFRAARAEWQFSDTLSAQQEEFFEITHPTLEPKTPEFHEALAAYQQELPQNDPAVAHGVWVCYPWKKIAVRVLPEDAFFRVRTARNRNLIPEDAQKKFAAATVAIAYTDGVDATHGCCGIRSRRVLYTSREAVWSAPTVISATCCA